MNAERLIDPIDERCIKNAAQFPRIEVDRLDAIVVEWNDAKLRLYELAVKQAETECGVTYSEIHNMYENSKSFTGKLSFENTPGCLVALFGMFILIPLLICESVYESVFPARLHERGRINKILKELDWARFRNCDRLIEKHFSDRGVAFYIDWVMCNPSHQTTGPRGGYVRNGVTVTTCPKSPRCVVSAAEENFICSIANDPNGYACGYTCATLLGSNKRDATAYTRYVKW